MFGGGCMVEACAGGGGSVELQRGKGKGGRRCWELYVGGRGREGIVAVGKGGGG